MSSSFFAWKRVACGCLVVVWPLLVSGQTSLAPLGGEYAINGALPGDQVYPCAAVSSLGGFLVWQDNAVTSLGLRIRAACLGSDWWSVSNFVVSAVANSKTAGDQERPQVALLNNGGAVFVWQGGKHGAQQIYARFLGANGAFLTKDVRVSTHTKNSQSFPQVASLADGTVVVVWSSEGQDGSMQGVFARCFSPAGKTLGSEFQVNQYTLLNQRTPAVAALANGNFVVVWISELQRGATSVDVYARIFDHSGLPVTTEFPVNQTNGICANPSVAGSPDGGFGIAWSQNNNPLRDQPSNPNDPTNGVAPGTVGVPSSVLSPDNWDVYGSLFDGNGNVTRAPFRLNTYTYGDQFAPRISAVGGNYLAVWTSLGQPDAQTGVIDPWEGVFGQLITNTGDLVFDADLHVNTTVFSRQIQPAVASDGASRFLVVWSSLVAGGDGFNFDIFAQQYQCQ